MKALLFLLITFSSFAQAPMVFSFGNLLVAFEEVDGFTVNEACGDKKCEAYVKAKLYSGKKIEPKYLVGGKNPASVRCKTLMNGKVLIGQSSKGHQQSFCSFSDHSYLMLSIM